MLHRKSWSGIFRLDSLKLSLEFYSKVLSTYWEICHSSLLENEGERVKYRPVIYASLLFPQILWYWYDDTHINESRLQ